MAQDNQRAEYLSIITGLPVEESLGRAVDITLGIGTRETYPNVGTLNNKLPPLLKTIGEFRTFSNKGKFGISFVTFSDTLLDDDRFDELINFLNARDQRNILRPYKEEARLESIRQSNIDFLTKDFGSQATSEGEEWNRHFIIPLPGDKIQADAWADKLNRYFRDDTRFYTRASIISHEGGWAMKIGPVKDVDTWIDMYGCIRDSKVAEEIHALVPDPVIPPPASSTNHYRNVREISKALANIAVTAKPASSEGVIFEAILPPCTEDEAFRIATAIDKQLEYGVDFHCSFAPTEDKTGFKLVIGPVEEPVIEMHEILQSIRGSRVSDTIAQLRTVTTDTTSPLSRLQQAAGLTVKQQGETFTMGWPNKDWDMHYATQEIFPKLDRLLPAGLSRFRFAAAKQGDWVIEMRRLSPEPISADEWEGFIKFFARDDVQTILHGKKRTATTSTAPNPTVSHAGEVKAVGVTPMAVAAPNAGGDLPNLSGDPLAAAAEALRRKFPGISTVVSREGGLTIRAQNHSQARRLLAALNEICKQEPDIFYKDGTPRFWASLDRPAQREVTKGRRKIMIPGSITDVSSLTLAERYLDTPEKCTQAIALFDKYAGLLDSAVTGQDFPLDPFARPAPKDPGTPAKRGA